MSVEMDKPHHVRVSDWDTRNLSEDQFKYACADAFASMEVGWRLYTCNCDDA
jgi:ribonuclease D